MKMLKSKIKSVQQKTKKPKGPLWKGPEEDGITQSLLSRFLVCRERFRLLVVEGLKPKEQFNKTLEYGQMWHTCEEALASGSEDWHTPLQLYCSALCQRYRMDQKEIEKWYNVCSVQFPEYVKYWRKHPDVTNRVPLLQEQTFNVPYKLPSGRVVRLRGKWDSVDLIGRGSKAAIYLQENKTKGDINPQQLKSQLQFDLQTMMYLVALRESQIDNEFVAGQRIAGVRYNVVRRPLSGGKGSIRPHKATKTKPAETMTAFYERLRRDYIAKEPEYWFARWRAEVTVEDIERFEREFLVPILEQLCDWWDWINKSTDPFSRNDGCENSLDQTVRSSIHWRTPFGFYNVLAEGGSTNLDEYLATGSTVGLSHVSELFTELKS